MNLRTGILYILIYCFAISCTSDEGSLEIDEGTSVRSFRVISPFTAIGDVNNLDRIIEVEFPFGQDISSIQFEIVLAEGASVTPMSPVNFSQGPVDFTVINNPDTAIYSVQFFEGPNPLRLILVGNSRNHEDLDPEIKEAYNWALDRYTDAVQYVSYDQLNSQLVSKSKVLWIHHTDHPASEDTNDNNIFESHEVMPESAMLVADTIRAYVEAGGHLLLTGLASSYVAGIGRIDSFLGPNIYMVQDQAAIDTSSEDGLSFQPNPFANDLLDFPRDNDESFIFENLMLRDYAFDTTIYQAIVLSQNGRKKYRAHFWDFDLLYPQLAPNPNASKNEFQEETSALVRASTIEDPRENGIDLGLMVEFQPSGSYQGRVMVLSSPGYEWNREDSEERLPQIEQITENILTEYIFN